MVIFYCQKCKSSYSNEDNGKIKLCPECKNNMVNTHMDADLYRAKSQEEKDELKNIFDLIEPIATAKQNKEFASNSIGKALSIIGWIIIILMIVLSIIFIGEYGAIGIGVGVLGAIGGLFIVGFGEIINLLQYIKNK